MALKFNPPMISLVYYFQNKQNEEYFHDIELDKKFIANATEEEICNHLYMNESFYFDPKEIKRH